MKVAVMQPYFFPYIGYFHPSLNTLNYVDEIKMPVSEEVSSKVLCLPLYAGLEIDELRNIVLQVNSLL